MLNTQNMQNNIEDIEKEEIRLPSKPILGKIMSKMVSKTGPSAKDKKMSVGTDCVRCGTCASICPSGNIVIGEKKAEIGDKCLHCYACYNFCPNGAIKYEGRNDHYKGLVKTEELKRR